MRVFQDRGEARTSFVSKLLEDGCTPEKEDVAKWVALSLYSGEYLCLLVCRHIHCVCRRSRHGDIILNLSRVQSRNSHYQLQTVASMETFFLAMCTHPLAQQAAQAELDRVIGHDRLPTISDRAQLPYIEALTKELLRWSPIAPLGELSMRCLWSYW